MIIQLMTMISKFWMFDGDRIPLIDSHVVIMLSFPASIPDFTSQVMRLWMLFYKTGTEFENNWLLPPVSQIARVLDHLKLCNAEGTLVIPMWKSFFGYYCVMMEDTGTRLFMIGLCFPNLSNSL